MPKDEMRGLSVYISDIRACKSSEAELKRINKELANIRQKFGDKKGLDGYGKKKYVCKLLFTFLLGHEVDFGHLEAVNLLSSVAFSEKQMGYLFVSVLLTENSELSRLIIQNCKSDLASPNELFVCLALHCIANVGGKEMAAAASREVQQLLVAPQSPFFVKKKAALCLLRFCRKAPELIPKGDFTARVVELITSPDLGVVTAVASLVLTLANHDPTEYRAAQHIAINRLHRLLLNATEEGYTYYSARAPWIVIKLLRILEVFPFPTDAALTERLNECLSTVLANAQKHVPDSGAKPKVNFFNANNACLFELVNLVVHYDNNRDLQVKIATQLGNFLTHKEVNMRYLALEGLAAIGETSLARDAARKHQATVLRLLKSEKDATVQQRAVHMLYAVCDTGAVQEIVQSLIEFLESAEYNLREELVLKIAILSEKYVVDYSWYVDVILKLLRIAGDYVVEEVWHRIIQVITNRQDVQDYAAKTCYEALLNPAAHETMVVVGAYVLGEYGNLIANDPNSSPAKQLQVLQSHYPLLSAANRAHLLTTYVKLSNLFPEMRQQIQQIFQSPNIRQSGDAEIQQRANEYLQLALLTNPSVLPAVLEEMPPYAERESSILAKLDKLRDVTDDTSGRKQRRQVKVLEQVSAAAVAAAVPAQTAPVVAIANADGFERFALTNSGVLYENPVIQIGAKGEFSGNMGRLTIFFGNRGQAPITAFSARAYMAEAPNALRIQAKPIDPTIPPGAQLQLVLQLDCAAPFAEPPVLDVNLTYQSRSVLLTLKLPVFVNKFFGPLPTPLGADEFFAKWNQLGGPPREVRHIVKSKVPIDIGHMRSVLVDFGFSVLDGVDPNGNNAVGVAILHTSAGQIGALLRVEPNPSAQMYRLTMRMSSDVACQCCCNLLASLF
eukprot:m.227075 g.227075  ORF g.227075 m.227075 type:complete len:899 (-) comp11528_c0_seq1:49-2745(-)